MEQNSKRNWNQEEVEREIERGEEEFRAWEAARMLTEKAELLPPKKGMPPKPTRLHVEPTKGIRTE